MEVEDSEEVDIASIRTTNTLSSLRHFVQSEANNIALTTAMTTPNGPADLDRPTRSSAFEPDLRSMVQKRGDFFSVERQRFTLVEHHQHTTSTEEGRHLFYLLVVCRCSCFLDLLHGPAGGVSDLFVWAFRSAEAGSLGGTLEEVLLICWQSSGSSSAVA